MITFIDVLGYRLETLWIAAPPGPRPGSPRPPPLVLLHEGLGSVGLWRDFPHLLAAATGAAVLAYSRPGHGRSSRPAESREPDYLHREADTILPAVLAHFGLENPVLIGHSDGASIALIHAAGPGRRVAGLILEAGHVFVEEITLAGIRAAVHEWQTTDLPVRLGRHHDDAQALFRAWSEIWLDPHLFRTWNIERLLPQVRCPCLVLQGLEDQYGTPAQVDAIARQVAGPAETWLLPACGHTPHREHPEAVLAAMVRFVGHLATAPSSA